MRISGWMWAAAGGVLLQACTPLTPRPDAGLPAAPAAYEYSASDQISGVQPAPQW